MVELKSILSKLALTLGVVHFAVGGMAHAAVSASLPKVGTKTVMNGRINTNIELITGQQVSISTVAIPHICCNIISANTTSDGRQQRSIQIPCLQEKFILPPNLRLGSSLVISANPNKESTGTITSQTTNSDFPADQTVNLLVVAEADNGMKFVNKEPIIFAGKVDQWPPNKSQYEQQGSTDFYIADENLEPTGDPVLRFFGSDVILLDVEFARFSAIATEEGISLEWSTAVERDNAGFYVWRGQPLSGQCSNDISNYPNRVRISEFIFSKSKTDYSGFWDYDYFDPQGSINDCYAIEAVNFSDSESILSEIVSVQ